MCFSAKASFVSAALLVTMGAVTMLGNRKKSQRLIAAVPFLFGVQQLTEGIIWQTAGEPSPSLLHKVAVISFMLFAHALWPGFIPWSIHNVEPNEKRKKILRVACGIGLFVSLIAGWILFNSDLSVYVSGHSLAYKIANSPRQPNWPSNLEFFLYIVPTVLPFFISSLRTVKLSGLLIFASMIITQFINKEASASIWCFFAGLISLYIAIHVVWVKKGCLT